jgi:hypothetical protein
MSAPECHSLAWESPPAGRSMRPTENWLCPQGGVRYRRDRRTVRLRVDAEALRLGPRNRRTNGGPFLRAAIASCRGKIARKRFRARRLQGERVGGSGFGQDARGAHAHLVGIGPRPVPGLPWTFRAAPSACPFESAFRKARPEETTYQGQLFNGPLSLEIARGMRRKLRSR